MVAAPASGSGKTTVTLGVLRALAARGAAVASAKAGPDYIDPGFHAAASGRPCINLDPWAMTGETLRARAARAAEGAGLLIVEGVMGLFDGAADGRGATADLAAALDLPVVLVVDVAGQGASVAALVEGFRHYRREVALAGVVCNRVAGARHADILARALAPLDVALLGCLPRDAELALPARHLGLVPAQEHVALEGFLERTAAAVFGHLDLEALTALARPLPATPEVAPEPPLTLGQRIALARDDAFGFAYPHLLDDWRRAGVEVRPFSPLADEAPAADCDAVFLPGGYPELHAGRLAGNRCFLDGLRAAADRGALVYGECGGYMVLGEGLTDGNGERHRMAGLLPLETSFAERHLQLGYRRLRLVADCPLGRAGAVWAGHEFHHATVLREEGAEPLFGCADAQGRQLPAAGLAVGKVCGSFMHLIERA